MSRKFFLIIVPLLILSGCFLFDKPNKKIIGKWKTIDNRNNSQMVFYIADTTILAEFWFDGGIKKTQYTYTVLEDSKSSLIIETKNYYKISQIDTIYINDLSICIAPQDGNRIDCFKIE
jgi:uncharacterized membrane protein